MNKHDVVHGKNNNKCHNCCDCFNDEGYRRYKDYPPKSDPRTAKHDGQELAIPLLHFTFDWKSLCGIPESWDSFRVDNSYG